MKNEPEELIDSALESRRFVWLDKVNPMSQINFGRIAFQDGSASERNSFFDMLNEEDPAKIASLAAQLEDLFPQNFEGSETVETKI